MKMDIRPKIIMKHNGGFLPQGRPSVSQNKFCWTLGNVVANVPGIFWHFGLRMNFKGSDCKGVWHKAARNFGCCHCRFGHYIGKSFVHGSHQNWRRYQGIRENGKQFSAFVQQRSAKFRSNRKQMKLQICWNKFLLEVPTTWWQLPLCCERTISIRRNCWWQSKRLKANKSADEKVFVAEWLHFASDDFLDRVLELFNGLMHSQQVPVEWRKTTFNMLPKHGRAKVPADIPGPLQASAFCTAYMIPGRVGPFLEAAQPEEQHVFRSGRRIDEHLVTTNLVIDKSWNVNMPI